MKIQCSGCEAAEAKVLCCADEAALCLNCDDKVHAANKLASKHHRTPLSSSDSSSSAKPKCDVCQESWGYFFCLEDRAVLCRKCDMSIHTMNFFVSSHQRFLLTGVKVGLPVAESSSNNDPSKPAQNQHQSVGKAENCSSSSWSTTSNNHHERVESGKANNAMNLTDLLVEGLQEKSNSFLDHLGNDGDQMSSKAAESEWYKILRTAEEELAQNNGAVEDFSWRVPQIFSAHHHHSVPVSHLPPRNTDSMGGLRPPPPVVTAEASTTTPQEIIISRKRKARIKQCTL